MSVVALVSSSYLVAGSVLGSVYLLLFTGVYRVTRLYPESWLAADAMLMSFIAPLLTAMLACTLALFGSVVHFWSQTRPSVVEWLLAGGLLLVALLLSKRLGRGLQPVQGHSTAPLTEVGRVRPALGPHARIGRAA